MALRTLRERVLQTLCYEAGGLVIVAPVYAMVMGRGTAEAFILSAALSAAVMVWSPIHNCVFDWADLRFTGRVASDRPHALRVVHAASHETSTVIVTVPILILLGRHSLGEALAVDLSMTLAYTFYAYLFYIVYDRMRPVSGLGARLPARHSAERARTRRDRTNQD